MAESLHNTSNTSYISNASVNSSTNKSQPKISKIFNVKNLMPNKSSKELNGENSELIMAPVCTSMLNSNTMFNNGQQSQQSVTSVTATGNA